jgi:hypothetical protein
MHSNTVRHRNFLTAKSKSTKKNAAKAEAHYYRITPISRTVCLKGKKEDEQGEGPRVEALQQYRQQPPPAPATRYFSNRPRYLFNILYITQL